VPEVARPSAAEVVVLGPAPSGFAAEVPIPVARPVGPKEAKLAQSQQAAVGPAATRRRTAHSIALETLLGMLRDRKKLASAMLLREILDKPLSLRRR
jgi:hypothetical protein